MGGVISLLRPLNTRNQLNQALGWSTSGTLGAAGDTTINGCVSYGDGAWIIITYDNSFQTARIWRSTSVSGTFSEVGTFASNGAALGGVRYIGP